MFWDSTSTKELIRMHKMKNKLPQLNAREAHKCHGHTGVPLVSNWESGGNNAIIPYRRNHAQITGKVEICLGNRL